MAHTPLTYEQHCEIARDLHETRERLIHWLGDNSFGNYPKTGPKSKFQQSILNVIAAIDKAKVQGEGLLFEEHSDQGDVHIYYPGSTGQPVDGVCQVCGPVGSRR